jgi:hypothetical protein
MKTIADVTNLQGNLSFPSISSVIGVPTHRRFFVNYGLYLACLNADAEFWDSGKPEWQRKVSLHFVYQ